MKIISIILLICLVFSCSVPILADSPVITTPSPEDPAVDVPFGSDYFVIIIAVLCISAAALAALLITSAIMKRKK